MSFSRYKQFIELNDTVILYLSNHLYVIVVKEQIKNKHDVTVENVFQTPFGALKVRNLIGMEYGSRVKIYL